MENDLSDSLHDEALKHINLFRLFTAALEAIKHMKFNLIIFLFIVSICAGCSNSCNFQRSEVMSSFNPATAFESAIKKYKLSYSYHQGGITGEAIVVEDYSISYSPQTDAHEAVMADYKQAVESELESLGAQVYGYNSVGNVQDFHVKYIAGRNRGGVLAYSALMPSGETRIIILTYEEAVSLQQTH